MSHLAQYILDIFSFKDQTLSLIFYFSLVVLPLITIYIGNKMPQIAPKIIGYIFYGVALVMSVSAFVFFYLIASSGEPIEGTTTKDWDMESIGASINLSLFAVYCGFGFILGYSLIQMASNPKKAVRGLIGMGAFALVLVISYQMADGTMQPGWEQIGVTEQDSIDASAGIIATAILTVLALGAIVIGEVLRLFR
jgi:hypothetical protein